MLPGSSRPANRLAQKPLSGLAPPAHRYSRFVHQLSDFPHVQHLRAQLRASPPRYYVAPVSLHPPAASQRWVSGYRRHSSPPVTPRSAPVVSDRCSYNGPAPVATETSFSVDVTGASGPRIARGLNRVLFMSNENGRLVYLFAFVFLHTVNRQCLAIGHFSLGMFGLCGIIGV